MASKSQFWNALPRFIWGEGLSAMPGELDERIFLTHTQFPRFVCEIWETDEIPEIDSLNRKLVGSFFNRFGVAAWQCTASFFFARWSFIDPVPNLEELAWVLRDAALAISLWIVRPRAVTGRHRSGTGKIVGCGIN